MFYHLPDTECGKIGLIEVAVLNKPRLIHNNSSLVEDTYHEIQERRQTLFTLSFGVIAWGMILRTNIFLHDLETLQIFYGVLTVFVCSIAYSFKWRYFQLSRKWTSAIFTEAHIDWLSAK